MEDNKLTAYDKLRLILDGPELTDKASRNLDDLLGVSYDDTPVKNKKSWKFPKLPKFNFPKFDIKKYPILFKIDNIIFMPKVSSKYNTFYHKRKTGIF